MSQSATLTVSRCAIVYMYNKKLALALVKASRLGAGKYPNLDADPKL